MNLIQGRISSRVFDLRQGLCMEMRYRKNNGRLPSNSRVVISLAADDPLVVVAVAVAAASGGWSQKRMVFWAEVSIETELPIDFRVMR